MSPLNFTTKAIEQIAAYTAAPPLTRAGFKYLTEKMRQAEIFVLPDHGQLLDRDKPRAEVPGILLRPAFPVVALEYLSPANTATRGSKFTVAPCSKRIALAWEWKNDLPAALSNFGFEMEGVAVASLAYFDQAQAWMPMGAAIVFPFDLEWVDKNDGGAFQQELAGDQVLSKAMLSARTIAGQVLPIAPEALMASGRSLGADELMKSLSADLMDEVNAYTDLCYALACRNVNFRRMPADAHANKKRIQNGSKPLKDFHVLQIDGGQAGTGEFGAATGKRSHLRRGHIRRLGPERITWVNQTMVRGQTDGFADKIYSMKGASA